MFANIIAAILSFTTSIPLADLPPISDLLKSQRGSREGIERQINMRCAGLYIFLHGHYQQNRGYGDSETFVARQDKLLKRASVLHQIEMRKREKAGEDVSRAVVRAQKDAINKIAGAYGSGVFKAFSSQSTSMDKHGIFALKLILDDFRQCGSVYRNLALSDEWRAPFDYLTFKEVVGVTVKDCPNCPEMKVLPAGFYQMGNPVEQNDIKLDTNGFAKPAHGVEVNHQIAVGLYEITYGEYNICVIYGGCKPVSHNDRMLDDLLDGQRLNKKDLPMVSVNRENITQYVGWLSKKTGHYYRLLTEAEWEYAARAGETLPYPDGMTIEKTSANFNSRRLKSVGSYKPNAFGLYDMLGNASEWVRDCWQPNYDTASRNAAIWTNFQACKNDRARFVLRGGSFSSSDRDVTLYSRRPGRRYFPDVRIGFRVAVDMP